MSRNKKVFERSHDRIEAHADSFLGGPEEGGVQSGLADVNNRGNPTGRE